MNTLSLTSILYSDAHALQTLDNDLCTRGWTFVELPSPLATLVTSCSHELDSFFQQTLDSKLVHMDNIDGTATDGAVFGYYRSEGHKEGLRLLTGGRLKKKWIPDSCPNVASLVTELDRTVVQLLTVISDTVFKVPFSHLQREDIPLIQDSKTGVSFGMLDVAYYTNEKHKVNSSKMSVAPHYDPGVLSLNVLSSTKGLQVRDVSGAWIDCPTGGAVGVIWAGELAQTITKGRVKPGWHQVTYDGSSPRLSIWIEACTKQQDLESTFHEINKMVAKKDIVLQLPTVLSSPNTNNTQVTSLYIRKQTEPPLEKIVVNAGEKLSTVLSQASRKYGIPMTKMITYYCPLCLNSVASLTSHAKEKHSSQIEYKGENDNDDDPMDF